MLGRISLEFALSAGDESVGIGLRWYQNLLARSHAHVGTPVKIIV